MYPRKRKLTGPERKTLKYAEEKQSRRKFTYDNTIVCRLSSFRCTGKTVKGHRCKRRVVVGLPKCNQHLRRDHGVEIKKQGAMGKGVFAARDLKPPFRITYGGELRNAKDLNAVYDEDDTAPYAIGINASTTLDAGCQRWVGSLLNHTSSKKRANMELVIPRSGPRRTTHTAKAFLELTKPVKKGTALMWNYGHEYEFGGKKHQTS
jgi:hypothetical protein